MNQSKLEEIKQEIARVNIDILGISELKWTGMDEFNSDDPIPTTMDKNPWEEMEPKWKQHPVVDATVKKVKATAVKNNIA